MTDAQRVLDDAIALVQGELAQWPQTTGVDAGARMALRGAIRKLYALRTAVACAPSQAAPTLARPQGQDR